MMALIIFGAISFTRLGVSQLPDVDFPVVSIGMTLGGASPEVMENQVVDLVEDAVMGVQGIRSVNSTARQSSASVSVEFEADRDIDSAVQELQSRIAQITPMLPASMDPLNIRKANPEDQPILWLSVSGDGSISREHLMRYARDVLFDQFATVKGVGDIGLGGYVDANLRIWLSLPKLQRYHLTATDVIQSIQAEHTELPAGRLENSKNETAVRIMGEARTPQDFEKLLVIQRGGAPNYQVLQLKDVARVEEGLADVRRYSRFNGNFGIGLGILKQHGSNAVEVADAVKERLKQVIPTLPKGMSLSVRFDNTKFIRDSVTNLCEILILSALLTSLVCYLFLGSWTSTVNVLMAIPTSIVGTFIVLFFFGFTLNTFTLLGLSLAIGIVVDDAIMMLESIVRKREKGESRLNAALNGSREISFAAIAATIAVIAVFLPVVFMKGIIGRYFFQYGITVAAAVALSLLEALTLTPMRCSRFLTIQETRRGPAAWMDRAMERLEKIYARILKTTLRRKKTVLLIALGVFVLSLALFKRLPAELLPAQDQSLFMVRVKAPVGSSLEATDRMFKEIEKYFSKRTEIDGYFSTVGGFGGDQVNEGQAFVTLKPPSQRKLSQRELMDVVRTELKNRVKGAKVSVQDMSLRGFSASRGYPLEFTIVGPTWERLGEASEKMIDELTNAGLATDLNSDYQTGMPEVKIVPIRAKLAEHGVALSEVASTVSTLIGGAQLGSSTRYSLGGHRYDIRVRLEGAERVNPGQLKQIRVRNNRGELISLSELVEIKRQPSVQVVTRRNRERAITISGNPAKGISQSEIITRVQQVATRVLPAGYSVRLSGNAQSLKESGESLILALVLGIFVAYMVLASQFNSFLHPVTVLLALPFSLSGALLGLWITGQSINMYSFIGLILLMGIVKKNSILLVDYTNQLRAQGKSALEALSLAGPVRLRPILMTSIATIAGALPEALALGPGAEVRIPMAVAIIGGVILSTLLTLVVIPSAYLAFLRLERKEA